MAAVAALWIFLGAQLAASARVSDIAAAQEGGPNIGSVSLDGDGIEGVAHVTLKKFFQSKLLTDIPGDLHYILEKQGLRSEYQELIQDILAAPKGWLGNWKSSEVYRAIHVSGHEVAFESKNVPVYLTKRVNEDGSSTLKLYFVDRTVQPTYIPDNVYADAGEVTARSTGHVKVMPSGVLAQFYGTNQMAKRTIKAQKSTLPVSVLKLLEKKDAVSLHEDFAAAVNSGGLSNMMVAMTVRDYEERFRSKGIGIFFCQLRSKDQTPPWYMWFEYADLDVAPSYRPAELYPVSKISKYELCMQGQDPDFVSLARPNSFYYHYTCREVVGARFRAYLDDVIATCKCSNENEMVFCGTKRVFSRKFDFQWLRTLSACRKHKPYCARKACLMPSTLSDEP